MIDVPKEAISLVYQLLPGFVAAWIFYGLTAHSKASPFERVVQALVFTVVIQVFTIGARCIAFVLGGLFSLGIWTDDAQTVVSIIIACLFGLEIARLANTSSLQKLLGKLRFTSRTSFPCEWYSAFSREKRWVVLNLKGQRRLFGWPYEWPDSPDKGHFIIDQPEWLLPGGRRAPLHNVQVMLVPVTEVEFVEFIRFNKEVTASEREIKEVETLLKTVNSEKEKKDGNQDPTAGTEQNPE